jgi:ubiquinone/menaquinone biosynthesis C-methylase UbiE
MKTQVNALATKIANIMNVSANDVKVKMIATGWAKFVELGMAQGMTFDEADAAAYQSFKYDTDNFAIFCNLVNL